MSFIELGTFILVEQGFSRWESFSEFADIDYRTCLSNIGSQERLLKKASIRPSNSCAREKRGGGT